MTERQPIDRTTLRQQALRHRERAARTRRVALYLPREAARRNLETIAGHIERDALELERRAAAGAETA